MSNPNVLDLFDLRGRVAVITGAGGLLGKRHVETVAQLGGVPVLLDIADDCIEAARREMVKQFGVQALALRTDITQRDQVAAACREAQRTFGRIDILINNAANNPKMEATPDGRPWSRFENFPTEVWLNDLSVGLTGAMLCAQVFGTVMAEAGRGVILNVASDLALIGPDQRIYQEPDLLPEQQPAKPVSYSVVKSGLVGLTRYLATYWAHRGVRVNAISPGGVETSQSQEFIRRLTNLIPLGRMAHHDEYMAAVAFLISDASSYMTGSNLVIDGGRTAW